MFRVFFPSICLWPYIFWTIIFLSWNENIRIWFLYGIKQQKVTSCNKLFPMLIIKMILCYFPLYRTINSLFYYKSHISREMIIFISCKNIDSLHTIFYGNKVIQRVIIFTWLPLGQWSKKYCPQNLLNSLLDDKIKIMALWIYFDTLRVIK